MALASSGDWLSSIDFSGEIKLWAIENGSISSSYYIFPKDYEGSITTIAFGSDQNILAAGTTSGQIILFKNPNSITPTFEILQGHNDEINVIAFSPNGKRVVSGSGNKWTDDQSDCAIRVWDGESGELLHILKNHKASVCSVAISPDSNYIVSGSYDKSVRMWDLRSGEYICEYTAIPGVGYIVVGVVEQLPRGGYIHTKGTYIELGIGDPHVIGYGKHRRGIGLTRLHDQCFAHGTVLECRYVGLQAPPGEIVAPGGRGPVQLYE